MDLSGQVALVTGGSRGLGRAFAAALAGAGARVAIAARSEEQLREAARAIERQGGRVLARAADVTDPQAVKQLVREVEQELGPVDLLVNNAGVFKAFGLVAEVEPQAWWREIEVNLNGPFLLSQAVLPGMVAKGGGRIINVVSRGGINAHETVSAYVVSKTALIRLTEILALEAGPQRVSVFALEPGTVRTPMNDYVVEADFSRQRIPGVHQWMRDLFESGRDTPIEQPVQLVLRIAAGQLDNLSGCFLSVEDDLDEMLGRAAEIQAGGKYKLRLNA